MKIRIILFICFFAGVTGVYAQNSAKQSKLSKVSESSKTSETKKDIPFPTTLKALSEIYGDSYEELSDPSTGKTSYQWNFEQGTILIFVPLTDTDQYIGIVAPYGADEPISGLPFDLVFNQTTLEECRDKFASYKPYWAQVVGDGDSNYFELNFKKDNSYNYLYFYKNDKGEDILKAFTISTTELE